MANHSSPTGNHPEPFFRRHMRAGWIGLPVFVCLGVLLETLHGLKLPFYLGPENITRRLLWTLAHAHGTLFSLINIAFAVSLTLLRVKPAKSLRWVSGGLIGALIILPLGFFLGGTFMYGGDPGLGVFLVPVGAVMLLLALAAFMVIVWRN
jgi:hypothetical protein